MNRSTQLKKNAKSLQNLADGKDVDTSEACKNIQKHVKKSLFILNENNHNYNKYNITKSILYNVLSREEIKY